MPAGTGATFSRPAPACSARPGSTASRSRAVALANCAGRVANGAETKRGLVTPTQHSHQPSKRPMSCPATQQLLHAALACPCTPSEATALPGMPLGWPRTHRPHPAPAWPCAGGNVVGVLVAVLFGGT
jgi:hypothetical protein